jgi:hypothetical protein
MQPDPPQSQIANRKSQILPWSAFLGVSWTWCIGMFLPVLLVRDYGVWGWLVFAVPNVIGAAAMGWVLPDASSSARLVESHGGACAAFSIVTIAFHVFFVGWLNSVFAAFAPFVLVAAAVIYLLGMRRERADTVTAACTFAASLACAVIYGRFRVDLPQPHGFSPALIGLVPVCWLGFVLCPYLDLTFHRARQATTTAASGRIAFTLGFGVVFLSMILFTLVYAKNPILQEFLDRGFFSARRAVYWPSVIAVHMILQCAFTLAVHARALVARASGADGRRILWWNCAAAAVAALLAYLLDTHRLPIRGEVIYRVFMGFYGLVFPAYVWVCMITLPYQTPTRRTLVPFAAGVVLAAPFYWLGFIEGKMLWLLPGLLIVLASRAAVPRNALQS